MEYPEKVEKSADSGGNTIVQIHAKRIGWTYYSYTKRGVQPITGKNGWNEETGASWNNF